MQNTTYRKLSNTKKYGEERVAVVTGASAGIGHAIVNELARNQIRVVANARRTNRLLNLERRWNGDGSSPLVAAAPGSVENIKTIRNIFHVCECKFGVAPDIFVVNAGRGLPGTVRGSNSKEWGNIFNLNCIAALNQMRFAANVMSGQAIKTGRQRISRDIVILGSVVGRNVSPFNPVYGATKSAIHSAAEALRQEMAKYAIRVTLIEPGIVLSEFQKVARYKMREFNKYATDIGPVLIPEDIARLLLFIISQPAHVHINNVMIRPTRQLYP